MVLNQLPVVQGRTQKRAADVIRTSKNTAAARNGHAEIVCALEASEVGKAFSYTRAKVSVFPLLWGTPKAVPKDPDPTRLGKHRSWSRQERSSCGSTASDARFHQRYRVVEILIPRDVDRCLAVDVTPASVGSVREKDLPGSN